MATFSVGTLERGLGLKVSIYQRYLSKTYLLNFSVVLLVFIFLMFSINAIPTIELLLVHHASLYLTFKVFIFMIPEIIVLVLPATFLMASLITLFNMTENNEHIVLISAGLSNWHIIKPILVITSLLVIPYFFFTSYIAPFSNQQLNYNLYKLIKLEPSILLKPTVFLEPFPNITLYANTLSNENQDLEQVLVMDKRDPAATLLVISKRLSIYGKESTGEVVFRFSNGSLTAIPKEGVPRHMQFEDYILTISAWEALGEPRTREPKPKELTLGELLRERVKQVHIRGRYGDLTFALYNRFILPVVGILMGTLGAILPLRFHFRQRWVALLSGLSIFFGYYTLLLGMKSLAKSGILNPILCVLVPLIFLALLLYFSSTWKLNQKDSSLKINEDSHQISPS